jgi:hypothetical protein
MNLNYAIDRLHETGWRPEVAADAETAADGRRYPSVLSVQQAFAAAGLELAIKHNLVFNCYRATWAPVGETLDPAHETDERHGTVIGACEREAAVFALAQLRTWQKQRHPQLAAV